MFIRTGLREQIAEDIRTLQSVLGIQKHKISLTELVAIAKQDPERSAIIASKIMGLDDTFINIHQEPLENGQCALGNIKLPAPVPFQTLDIYVRVDSSRYPEAFLTVVSHELSHWLLHRVSPYASNERYVDLTTLVLGFGDVVEKGRNQIKLLKYDLKFSDKECSSACYLTDAEFFAAIFF